MKGRNPTAKEKRHMDKVQRQGCIVCRRIGYGRRDAEIHHVIGKTKPNAHMMVLPLCFEHHRMGSDKPPYISRHPYKKRFIDAYGTEEELLALVDNYLVSDDIEDYLPF